jgi:hypothetical protein
MNPLFQGIRASVVSGRDTRNLLPADSYFIGKVGRITRPTQRFFRGKQYDSPSRAKDSDLRIPSVFQAFCGRKRMATAHLGNLASFISHWLPQVKSLRS